MELYIRGRQFGACLGENADLTGAHRHGAAPEQDILSADQHPPEEVVDLVVQGRDIHFVDHADLQMILQVLADAGQVVPHRDVQLCSRSPGPIPETWKICGEPMAPARENDLAARLEVRFAFRALDVAELNSADGALIFGASKRSRST